MTFYHFLKICPEKNARFIKICQEESILYKKMYAHLWQYDQPHGSESLTTNQEVPVSIPRSTVGIFPEGEDSRGNHGLGRLVEFRFKDPPDTTCSYITTHIIGTT